MKALGFTASAEADINGIWDYTAENWGVDQAERYTDDIRDMCQALAKGKKRGRPTNLRNGFWKCPCGSHVIWYRDHADRLDIIRILHAAQDVERHLQD